MSHQAQVMASAAVTEMLKKAATTLQIVKKTARAWSLLMFMR